MACRPLKPLDTHANGAQSVERINALIRNARNTWFVLLGVLVFVGVTLMGVQHVDFYGANRSTKLPLVDVAVPTELFFIAAPILTAAVYGYFHLYLIRLWDVLGEANARNGNQPLGDTITPWLVADAALYLRARLRKGENPPCATPRVTDFPATLLNLGLAWFFGILVLAIAWWLTQAARDTLMNLIVAACLVAAIYTGGQSAAMLFLRMRSSARAAHSFDFRLFVVLGSAVLAFILFFQSVISTGQAPETLARIDLTDAAVTERPADWLPYDIAKRDFLAIWCKREDADCKQLSDKQRAALDEEWQRRRRSAVLSLRRPDLRSHDLRHAIAPGAFLSGANLGGAQTQGANLRGAHLEAANLSKSQMQGVDAIGAHLAMAVLSEAQMEGADLWRAQMEGANLRGAQMEGANLREAQMEGAVLSFARLEGAVLREAQMEGAVLSFARLEGAVLSFARLEGADLSFARLEGAVLRGAQMEGADLSFSWIAGRADLDNVLEGTNLRASTNDGGALRFVDLRNADLDGADLRNAFLDGSVTRTAEIDRQMADPLTGELPCQWRDDLIEDDAEFFGLWRAWLESRPDSPRWEWFAPEGWRDVPPQPLPSGCEMKDLPPLEPTEPAD